MHQVFLLGPFEQNNGAMVMAHFCTVAAFREIHSLHLHTGLKVQKKKKKITRSKMQIAFIILLFWGNFKSY